MHIKLCRTRQIITKAYLRFIEEEVMNIYEKAGLVIFIMLNSLIFETEYPSSLITFIASSFAAIFIIGHLFKSDE